MSVTRTGHLSAMSQTNPITQGQSKINESEILTKEKVDLNSSAFSSGGVTEACATSVDDIDEQDIDFFADDEQTEDDNNYELLGNNPFQGEIDRNIFRMGVKSGSDNSLQIIDNEEEHNNYQKQKAMNAQMERVHWVTQDLAAYYSKHTIKFQDNQLVSAACKSFSFSAASAYAATHRVMKGTEKEFS